MRRSMRYFILGPAIIVTAFTLPNWPAVVVQCFAGMVYIALGVMKLKLDGDES